MPSTLVRLSNQVQAEAGSCVSQWFLLCDMILRALLCLGEGVCVDMRGGQKKRKEFKEWRVKKREEGRKGDKQRDRNI